MNRPVFMDRQIISHHQISNHHQVQTIHRHHRIHLIQQINQIMDKIFINQNFNRIHSFRQEVLNFLQYSARHMAHLDLEHQHQHHSFQIYSIRQVHMPFMVCLQQINHPAQFMASHLNNHSHNQVTYSLYKFLVIFNIFHAKLFSYIAIGQLPTASFPLNVRPISTSNTYLPPGKLRKFIVWLAHKCKSFIYFILINRSHGNRLSSGHNTKLRLIYCTDSEHFRLGNDCK